MRTLLFALEQFRLPGVAHTLGPLQTLAVYIAGIQTQKGQVQSGNTAAGYRLFQSWLSTGLNP